MRPSATGSAAMPVSPPSATDLPPPQWGRADTFCRFAAVFFVTAALLRSGVPHASLISRGKIDPERAHGGPRERPAGKLAPDILGLRENARCDFPRLPHAVSISRTPQCSR